MSGASQMFYDYKMIGERLDFLNLVGIENDVDVSVLISTISSENERAFGYSANFDSLSDDEILALTTSDFEVKLENEEYIVKWDSPSFRSKVHFSNKI